MSDKKNTPEEVLHFRVNGVFNFSCTKRSWVGFDLDGTLAKIEPVNLRPPYPIGVPEPSVVEALKKLHSLGVRCKLFTARVANTQDLLSSSVQIVKNWLEEHDLSRYFCAVTATKDPDMVLCIDDRALRVSEGQVQKGEPEPLLIELV